MRDLLLKQLGDKIKQQRASLSRNDVGLPLGDSSKKDKGLSQQEVAVLSGVSSRWLAHLEQGVFKHGQFEQLSNVLQTLRFSPKQQELLLKQAGWTPQTLTDLPKEAFQAHLQQLLDGIEYPAYIVNYIWERICWNKAATKLFSHWLGPQAHYTNFLHYILLDPQSRMFFKNWDQVAPQWVNRFLEDTRPYGTQSEMLDFQNNLRKKSPTFAQQLNLNSLNASNLPMHYVFHTAKGFRAYNRVAFPVESAPNWRMIVWLPSTDSD